MAGRRTKNTTVNDYRVELARLGYSLSYNEVTSQVEVNGTPLTDAIEARIRVEMAENGLWGGEFLEKLLLADAYRNRYHPIQKYINALPGYDGWRYIEELALCFQNPDGLFYSWLRHWLIAAVAKVIKGAQCPMLVLDGPQGIGKSLFARWLCSEIPAYFTEGPIDPDSKDHRLRLTRKWIWEVSELGATTRRADIEALKAFLSTGEITERKAYGKYDETRKALSCFIGTVNDASTGVLADPTGTRRFLITHIEAIDWQQYTQRLTPWMIWSEAYTAYLAGEQWELSAQERQISEENNENYRVEDPIEAALKQYYNLDPDNNAWFTSTWALTQKLQAEGIRMNNPNAFQKALAETLKRMGFRKYRMGRKKIAGYVGIQIII